MSPTLDFRPITLATAARMMFMDEREFWEVFEMIRHHGEPLSCWLGVGGLMFDPREIRALIAIEDGSGGQS